MPRTPAWPLGALLAVVAVLVPIDASAEAPASPRADFFDVGVAVGAPGESVGGVDNAGSVTVFLRSTSHLGLAESGSVLLTQASVGGTPRGGNQFGAAVALGDLNGDSLSDLAIGVPGADNGAGRVYVVFRDPADGQLDQEGAVLVRAGHGGITGTTEPGDRFGAALLIGARSGGEAWLAIGAPGEDVGRANGAGAVTIIPGGTDGSGDVSFYQGKGIPGTAESGDAFGASLAAYGLGGLAIGAPTEDDGTITDAGQVTGLAATTGGLPGTGPGTSFKQGTGGVPGTSERGDRFGTAIVGRLQNALAIGIPGEDVGSISNAGDVVDIPVPGHCCTTATNWYQGHNGLIGTAEAGDGFGSALAATSTGNLVVGAPTENVLSAADAGVVHVIGQVGGGSSTLTGVGDQTFHQGGSPASPGDVAGHLDPGDRFGAALSTGVNAIFVGVPGEDIYPSADDCGALVVVPTANGFAVDGPGNSQILQGTRGVPGMVGKGDAFGASLSGRLSSGET